MANWIKNNFCFILFEPLLQGKVIFSLTNSFLIIYRFILVFHLQSAFSFLPAMDMLCYRSIFIYGIELVKSIWFLRLLYRLLPSPFTWLLSNHITIASCQLELITNSRLTLLCSYQIRIQLSKFLKKETSWFMM